MVEQAFRRVDVTGPLVMDGRYDLLGPDGEIISPTAWDHVVKPGWNITMRMWPLEEDTIARINSRYGDRERPFKCDIDGCYRRHLGFQEEWDLWDHKSRFHGEEEASKGYSHAQGSGDKPASARSPLSSYHGKGKAPEGRSPAETHETKGQPSGDKPSSTKNVNTTTDGSELSH